MRAASAVLEDLLILIEAGELVSRPKKRAEGASPKGRERWAIDCARRAVGANVEWCGPALPALRGGLIAAKRWLEHPPNEDQRNDASTRMEVAQRSILAAQQNASRGRLNLERTLESARAVALALDCAAGLVGAEAVAAIARGAFPEPEVEAGSQARRLLLHTKLLPSGPELLVRLDYAESRGRLPQDQARRAWIESQRALLMTNDEGGRLTIVLHHLELLFLAELERLTLQRSR